MSDDDPTPEELREAEALARALERRGKSDDAPADALGAAGLLRHARADASLQPDARAKVGARIATALDGRRPRKRRPFLAWLVPLTLVPAAATFLLMMQREASRAPSALRPATLPAPTAALLHAQAEAARGSRQAMARLDDEMRGYRAQLYRSLGGGAQ